MSELEPMVESAGLGGHEPVDPGADPVRDTRSRRIPWLADLPSPAHRGRLLAAPAGSLLMALGLGGGALAAELGAQLLPARSFWWLLGLKLLTGALATTVMWRGRSAPGRIAFWLGFNVLTDLALLATAVHLTGGLSSPLVVLYMVPVILAGLSMGAGAAVASAVLALATHAGLVILGAMDALPVASTLTTRLEAAPAYFWIAGVTAALLATALPTAAIVVLQRALGRGQKALSAQSSAISRDSHRRNELMATLTHELRNPIQRMRGLCDLLDEKIYGPMTKKQQEAVRTIRGSADDLLRLIEDHLQLAKDEAGRLDVQLSEVNLSDLLHEVLAQLEWMRQSRHVDLAISVAEDVPILLTDRDKLVRVVINLLTNAFKYTPDGGRILVRARLHEDDRVALTIRDTGEGIPEADLGKIFDPFHQVSGDRPGGVGLGLNLVKRLVHMLGGEIEVGSHLGAGSTFMIRIPVGGPASTA